MSELIVVEKIQPVEIFTKPAALDALLSSVRDKVFTHDRDVTTAKGRKDIASVAYRVAQAKTKLDNLGKEEVAKLKELPKQIDAGRKTARDFLEQLQADYRQPLTEWEEAEKARIEQEEAAREQRKATLAGLEEVALHTEANVLELPLQAIQDRLGEIAAQIFPDEVWGDEKENAEAVREQVKCRITAAIERRQKQDADQAELAKLRQAEEERKAKEEAELIAKEAAERDARIAKEAEERAKREAEELAARQIAEAKAAREKAEREAKEAAERAEREKREAVEAVERKAREEAERVERERRELEAKAKAEAGRLEHERVAKEAAERAAAEKKAANTKHRATINAAIVAALMDCGVDAPTAGRVIEFVAAGKVPHIQINY